MEWNKVSVCCLPTSGVKVHTKIEDDMGVRNSQILIYDSGLWWVEDKSMYVYYQPTHWAYINELLTPQTSKT